MRKLKRALSAVLVAALILSLMPAFAFAADATTYTYNLINADGYTAGTTTVTGADGGTWTYVGAYLSATGYPMYNKYGMLWRTGYVDRGAWTALKFKAPAAGTYDMQLSHYINTYNPSAMDVYLLSEGTTAPTDGAVYSFDENDRIAQLTATEMASSTIDLGSVTLTGDNNDEFTIVFVPTAFSGTYTQTRLYLSSLTLTAQEVEVPVVNYTVTYDAAGGTVTPASETVAEGTVVTLPTPAFEGYTFNGWSDGTTTYEAGAEYTVNGNVTLTAGWTRNIVNYTVTYDANGGTVTPASETVAEGTVVTLPTPSYEGYTFNGWSDGTTTYEAGASYTVNGNVTLTAGWTAIPQGPQNVVVEFNSTTLIRSQQEGTTYYNVLTAVEGANFSVLADKTMLPVGHNQVRSNAAHLLLRKGITGKNWLAFVNDESYTENDNAGKITIRAKDLPAGTYKVDFSAIDHNKGAAVYLYVGGKYVGVRDTYDSSVTYTNSIAGGGTAEPIGYVTVADSDADSSNANPVEIAIHSAAIDSPIGNILTLTNITFTPVDEVPASNTLTCKVDGEDAKLAYNVENGATLSLSAMLDGKHLNGYTVDGVEDTMNCIKVISNNANVTVTDTKAALTSASIVASDYQPVYTVKALKSNAQATITVQAIVNGEVAASKTFAVSVAKSDADYFVQGASYAWGVNYAGLEEHVSVGSVVAGNVGSVTKGTELTLSAVETVTTGDVTYKFVGWKRGGANDVVEDVFGDATSYISFSSSDTFKLFANTYITAVYDKVEDEGGKIVEFYNQDGTFLGVKSEDSLAGYTLPEVSLLGHTFEKWQYINKSGEAVEFTTASELYEAVTRVVAKQNPDTVTITFADGIYGEEVVASSDTTPQTYYYGDRVSADAFYTMPENAYTVYWTRDGLVPRTYKAYPFYAWSDAVVFPTYVDRTTMPEEYKLPKVIVDADAKNGAYMIEYDIYNAASYTTVEAGILFSDTENVTLSTFAGGEKFTSQRNSDHGQFAAKANGDYSHVRGYIIYKDASGELGVAYSNDVTIG